MVTQALLRELLDYNPYTGQLIWKPRSPDKFKGPRQEADAKTWNNRFAGTIAGARSSNNRRQICVNGVNYNVHKIVWILVHGTWDGKLHIDHINGDPSDNRICNLRQVTRIQNLANRHSMGTNTSGAVGVHCDRRKNLTKRWIAQIRLEGSVRFIGRFETLEEAHAAYARAKVSAFGEFANCSTNDEIRQSRNHERRA